MPYIHPHDRILLNDPQSDMTAENAGQLNYQITTLCDQYVSEHGACYTTLNAVIGALECAKLELYRRVIAPYEDKKCQTNGDVYTVIEG